MIRNATICMIVGWIVSASILGWAENSPIVVRVLTTNKNEGIDGVVLLLNPGNTNKSKVFITDKNGVAYISGFNCSTCTVTAIDPRGMFFSATTEFDRRSSTITLIMEVRPIVDKVGEPGAMETEITIQDSGGIPLPKQDVIVRPREMTLTRESNWFYTDTTDSKGKIRAKLTPGEYTIARLVNGEVWEASFSVIVQRSKRCAEEEKKRIQSSFFKKGPEDFLTVRISKITLIPSEK
jgi:hypothetical protein